MQHITSANSARFTACGQTALDEFLHAMQIILKHDLWIRNAQHHQRFARGTRRQPPEKSHRGARALTDWFQ
jgi:hypothetical protein